ncbi:hypothetical protein MRX96_038345 [Rhipicephalus microplus]
MHKFRHYDGIAYVSASLSRELVSIEKTVLMNYGTDRSEVICRTYVRKTLISEKVAYNLEDAKQVLDCANLFTLAEEQVGRRTSPMTFLRNWSSKSLIPTALSSVSRAKERLNNKVLHAFHASVCASGSGGVPSDSVRTLKVINLTETHLEPNSFEDENPFRLPTIRSICPTGPGLLQGHQRRCGSIEATQLFFS